MSVCRKSISVAALALMLAAGTTPMAAAQTIGAPLAESEAALTWVAGSLCDRAHPERISAEHGVDASASNVAAPPRPSRPMPSLAQRVGGQLLMALVVGIAAVMLAVLFAVSARPGRRGREGAVLLAGRAFDLVRGVMARPGKPRVGAFRSMKQMFNGNRE